MALLVELFSMVLHLPELNTRASDHDDQRESADDRAQGTERLSDIAPLAPLGGRTLLCQQGRHADARKQRDRYD
jgi:hypothetical protein